MKNKSAIIAIASIFLVLAISFFIFNIQKYNLTGFDVYDNITQETTKEMALQAINESEDIIKEMQENNFSVNYMNDNLIEAKRVFKQAEYASILRGEVDATEREKQEARTALGLIKWQNITYKDVLAYTMNIKERKQKTFLLLDKISVEENNLRQEESELKSTGLLSSPLLELSKETMDILEQAELAFSEERYDDAERLLGEYNNAVEKEKADALTLSGIKNGAKNFFQRYKAYIIILLIISGTAGYFSYKKFEKKLLKNKIKKIRIEEQVLTDLMKKTQEERFKENKIPELVYNIRMKKYHERLQEIKEELPVLEEKLKTFKNKENLDK